MSQFEHQSSVAGRAELWQCTNEPNMGLAFSMALRDSAPKCHVSKPDSFRKAPATPLMVSPITAWRRLCARTGGGIALGTLYRWIRNGKLHSIRMGKRVFIPVTALDELIDLCLRGEEQ